MGPQRLGVAGLVAEEQRQIHQSGLVLDGGEEDQAAIAHGRSVHDHHLAGQAHRGAVEAGL